MLTSSAIISQGVFKFWTALSLLYLFLPKDGTTSELDQHRDNSVPISTSISVESFTPQASSSQASSSQASTFDHALALQGQDSITIDGKTIHRIASILASPDFNQALRQTTDPTLVNQTMPFLEAAQHAQRLSDESIFNPRNPAWGYNAQIGELIRRTNNFARLVEALEILLVKHKTSDERFER